MVLRRALARGDETTSGLDRRERLAGFAAAGLALLLGLVLWVPALFRVYILHGSGTYSTTPVLGVLVGFAAAGLLALATMSGKRLLLTFVAMAVGLYGPWGSEPVVGFPFLILAFWQMMRYTKIARQRNELKRAAARASTTSGTSKRSKGAPEVHRPSKSSRYTPPRVSRR